MDGNNVQPLVVDAIQIFVGQRYSFILTANQPVKNYWIRALPNLPANSTFTGGINSAILRYKGAADAEPTTSHNITNPLVETNLHPLKNQAAPGIPKPGAADVNLNLDIQFINNNQFTINNASFIPPSLPVLLQIISGASTPQELLPPGDVYVLPPNKVIEISVPGGSAGSPVSNKCIHQ